MTDNNLENQPATKGDIKLLKGDVTLVKGDIKLLKDDVELLKGDVALVKTELKADIKRLEGIAKTNTLDILHIKDELRDIHETMATKTDINRILGAIDTFAGEAKDYRRKDLDRGHTLMTQEDKLQDHETRIQKLEAK